MIVFWIIIVTVSLRRASFTFALLWGKTRKHFRQYFNRGLWNGFLNDRNLSTSIWPDQKAKCKMTLICLNFWMRSRGSDWLLTFTVFISSQGFSILRGINLRFTWSECAICAMGSAQYQETSAVSPVDGEWWVQSQSGRRCPATHPPTSAQTRSCAMIGETQHKTQEC